MTMINVAIYLIFWTLSCFTVIYMGNKLIKLLPRKWLDIVHQNELYFLHSKIILKNVLVYDCQVFFCGENCSEIMVVADVSVLFISPCLCQGEGCPLLAQTHFAWVQRQPESAGKGSCRQLINNDWLETKRNKVHTHTLLPLIRATLRCGLDRLQGSLGHL